MSNTTEGKILGRLALINSQVLAFIIIIGVVILLLFTNREINLNSIISGLLTYEGSIVAIVWGSKASSNFATKKNDKS